MPTEALILTRLETAEEVSGFCCQQDPGAADLEDFLKDNALDYEHNKNVSRTYLAWQDGTLVGFFTLSCGSLRIREEGEEVKEVLRGDGLKGLTFSIPVVILGRLATDDRHTRRGIGSELFRWAAIIARERVASQVGCRYLFVDAYEHRQTFYEGRGCEMIRGPKGKEPPKRIHLVLDLTA